ncbi:hypothetical protein OROGR_008716 [Orobanche gracilis]
MSTSSARRVKERAASAEKITPSAGKFMPTGKENPRATSRIRGAMQKPGTRPIDKSAVDVSRAEPRVRKSTSSVPRGRSSSPSEFVRVSTDFRNNSRASLGPPQKKVTCASSNERSGGRYYLRNRVSKDFEKNEKIEIPVVKDGNLGSVAVLHSNIEEKVLKSLEKNDKSLDEKAASSRLGVEVGLSSGDSKMANKLITSKYPSKLHEKLSFLEGRVKKIASEIKKAKDMLGINNLDPSKVILSSIQEKISGIEKAMGVVEYGDGDTEMESVENGEENEKENEKDLMDANCSMNGLNVEDMKMSKTSLGESDGSFNADKGKVVILFDASLGKKEKKAGREAGEVEEVDGAMTFAEESSSMNGNGNINSLLMADENLDDFDDGQEGVPTMMFDNEVEEICTYPLNDVGGKSTTGGWFVSEGESVLLAHDDGFCSFYDIANCEEKAMYRPPSGISPNIWRDCWLIRAPSADGCSGKYIVAASAGNSLESGFCSWDFYTKDIRGFQFEDQTALVRPALAPLPNNTMYDRRNPFMANENRRSWYKPCGPLIVSAASCQRAVQIYDIRDGDRVMNWELAKPVLDMDYTSPLHWRNRGKVVVAESGGVSLWDVSSLVSLAVMSVSSAGRISALHVNNSDAEMGGVRQRVSSSEAEGNDGVFCTPDSINVLDFRQPSGIALKIPKTGVHAQSSFSRGDSIYIGCTNLTSSVKNQSSSSQIQQFSLRKQRLLSTYTLPESNAHHHFTALTQVWGNSSHVMGVCGIGLFVFDSLKDDSMDLGSTQSAKETVGPNDMYAPSFDYSASRVLIISRDRPACWRYLF